MPLQLLLIGSILTLLLLCCDESRDGVESSREEKVWAKSCLHKYIICVSSFMDLGPAIAFRHPIFFSCSFQPGSGISNLLIRISNEFLTLKTFCCYYRTLLEGGGRSPQCRVVVLFSRRTARGHRSPNRVAFGLRSYDFSQKKRERERVQ